MILALLFLISACGYRLVGEEINLPEGITQLAVAPAKNLTMEAKLEQFFTEALVEALRSDNRIKLVDKKQAQAILFSELIDLKEAPLAFDRFGRVSLIEIRLSLRANLKTIPEQKILWGSGIISASEQYPVGDDFLGNAHLRDKALKQICEKLALVISEQLLSGF